MPLRPLLLFVIIALRALGPTPAIAAAETPVIEEQLLLPVTIAGHDERLETLIVRPAPRGRYPIALIVNGTFPNPQDSHPAGLADLAHDFAHRGWLAAIVTWRGYGASTGRVQSGAGTCAAPDTARFLDAHADDLAAALTALRARPDADPAVAIGLGFSIGGVSMLDLAARPDRPLAAVINVSGGLYRNAKPLTPDPKCRSFEPDLVRDIAAFGRAHRPTLWLYAENDPWFRPGLVRRMAAAYRARGGNVDLDIFPPFGADGHTLFLATANVLTQPAIDAFLRAHDLPAMAEDAAFAPLLAALPPGARDRIADYLRLPTEKALAVPNDRSGIYYHFASRSIAAARREALAYCEAQTLQPCTLIAENRTLLDAWRQIALRR